MSIDSWYATANQPHAAAAVDRRDRQTEGWRWNCKSGQHINLYLPRIGSSTKTQQCASINMIKTKTTTKSVINKWHFVLMYQHNILNNQLYSPFTKLVATMQEWTIAEDIARVDFAEVNNDEGDRRSWHCSILRHCPLLQCPSPFFSSSVMRFQSIRTDTWLLHRPGLDLGNPTNRLYFISR